MLSIYGSVPAIYLPNLSIIPSAGYKIAIITAPSQSVLYLLDPKGNYKSIKGQISEKRRPHEAFHKKYGEPALQNDGAI